MFASGIMRLDRALPEGARADDARALVVLQRARDNFRGGSRAAVHQNDQRLAVGDVARLRLGALDVGRIAALRDDDDASFEKRVRKRDGLIEKAARVVPEIENVSGDVARRESS